ncbi:MAG TPA: carboxymuconolactone decarboxylase family protein [Desulfomonilaceae bacterium]|nr:carboxymuconolactone decarboxylase family protein [Desulfomonilaceae bacterium]
MYLPEIFKTFVERHREISEAYFKVGALCSQAGSMDPVTQHLIQMAISVGANSKGGVRSHARRALEAGASEEQVLQTVLLSTTIIGFPAMIAAYGWLDELLSAKE